MNWKNILSREKSYFTATLLKEALSVTVTSDNIVPLGYSNLTTAQTTVADTVSAMKVQFRPLINRESSAGFESARNTSHPPYRFATETNTSKERKVIEIKVLKPARGAEPAT